MLESVDIHCVDGVRAGELVVATTRSICSRLAPGVEIGVHQLADVADAHAHGFVRGVTVRVNGREIGPGHTDDDRFAGDTAPAPAWMIEASVAHALEPQNILFLDRTGEVGSRIALAMARALAPPSVGIQGGGTEPVAAPVDVATIVREIGVRGCPVEPLGLRGVELDPVQLVIRLDTVELPSELEPVPRISWLLPDPPDGDDPGRPEALREIRDTIRERLYVLFHG